MKILINVPLIHQYFTCKIPNELFISFRKFDKPVKCEGCITESNWNQSKIFSSIFTVLIRRIFLQMAVSREVGGTPGPVRGGEARIPPSPGPG